MKLAMYRPQVRQFSLPVGGFQSQRADGKYTAGWVEDDATVVDLRGAYLWDCRRQGSEPDAALMLALSSVTALVEAWELIGEAWLDDLRFHFQTACTARNDDALNCTLPLSAVEFTIPVQPRSFRDFYAFQQHVERCRSNRGAEMVPQWYEMPVFYFSNPFSFMGPKSPVFAPKGCERLDFELEVACVVGKAGKNIRAADAHQHMIGLVVLNDWSARDIQMQEVAVGLGPAKGKDFATSFGPYLVTLSELSDCRFERDGQVHYRLSMTAAVNGHQLSEGNLGDLYFSFGQMLERASSDVQLMPCDVIASGTVGTGCILELTPEVQPWLHPGDIVSLSVEHLGTLETEIVPRPV